MHLKLTVGSYVSRQVDDFSLFLSLRQFIVMLLLGRDLLGAKGMEEGKGSRMG